MATMKNKWTEQNIEEFKRIYPFTDTTELSRRYGVKIQSIRSYASKLGLKKQCFYTEEEDQILSRGFSDGQSVDEIRSMLPNRTTGSIKSRMQALGQQYQKGWTNEENQILSSLYPVASIDEVMLMLPGRSRNAITIHAQLQGVRAYTQYPDYSAEELDFIKNNYLSMSDEQIGQILGRSKDSIKNHRNAIGLHRVDRARTKYEDVSVYVRRHNAEWKIRSMRECGFRCVACGGRFDHIHHLVALSTIIRDVYRILGIAKEEFDINSLSEFEKEEFMQCVYAEQDKYPQGVCLTREIHTQFHNIYGYGDNTILQFQEFIERNYPGALYNKK